jgi:hypothetical protein
METTFEINHDLGTFEHITQIVVSSNKVTIISNPNSNIKTSNVFIKEIVLDDRIIILFDRIP